MPINPVIKPPKEDDSGFLGGALGGIAGTVLGGLIGALAGPGGAAAGAMSGAGLGGSLGGTAGGLIGKQVGDTPDNAQAPSVQQAESRTPMMTVKALPEVQMATMQNSKNLLAQSNMPDAQNYMDMIDQAQGKLKNRLGMRSSIYG